MRKLYVTTLLFLSFLALTSCGDVFKNIGGSPGGNPSTLTVSLESSAKTSIVINSVPVIYAHIQLTDPAGGVQSGEWTPGSSLTFVFHSDYNGIHTLDFYAVDSNQVTNSASTTVNMAAGNNYYITITLGGSVIVIINNSGQLPAPENTASSLWLASEMDQYHNQYYVYDDASSAGNNFNSRGYMGSVFSQMTEDVTNNPLSGLTCIRVNINGSIVSGWAGCYFLNGVLSGNNWNPELNWGTYPSAGVDLRGATVLTFWARGENGGEKVEFYAFGVGRDTNTGAALVPYPDSAAKISLGTVTLSGDWKQYTIDVSGSDLSYVLGGFGWSAVSKTTPVVFYLDNISYNLPRLTSARFLPSYRTVNSTNFFDVLARNSCYIYDASLAVLSFLAVGENERARMIADALVYAQDHDRYFTDGRLRNAYQAGELVLPPGWKPNGKTGTVRLPGYWDSVHKNWYEDEYSVSTSTGNVAWAMLALLGYYQTCGGQKYLDSVKKMGDWVVNYMSSTSGAGGFIGGKRGWEQNQTDITYKSTEHNLDLYVAFKRLYEITGESRWQNYSIQASNFVLAMFHTMSTQSKFFFTGTLEDGVTINEVAVPTDCQSWTLLAFRNLPAVYQEGLVFAEVNNRIPGTWGFDFSSDKDGTWYEGTAHLSLAYRLVGQYDKSSWTLESARSGMAPSGAVYASDKEFITSGFANIDGSPWLFFHRESVGPTTWLVFAEKRVNPYWIGTPYAVIP